MMNCLSAVNSLHVPVLMWDVRGNIADVGSVCPVAASVATILKREASVFGDRCSVKNTEKLGIAGPDPDTDYRLHFNI